MNQFAATHPTALPNQRLFGEIPRRLMDVSLIAYILTIAYLSFVPFTIVSTPLFPQGGSWFWGLQTRPISVTDVAANIAIYIPMGFLAAICIRRRDLLGVTTCALATAICSAASATIEYSQHFFISRVPSWIDVNANTFGALLGAIGYLIYENRFLRFITHAEHHIRRNPWLAAAKVFACLVVAVHLRPYDALVDARTVVRNALQAQASPLARWQSLPSKVEADVRKGQITADGALPRAQWDYALDRALDTASYAIAAALVILGLASESGLSLRAFFAAGLVTCGISAFVTIIRIFFVSHGFDSAHFFTGLIGWPIGAALGASLYQRHLAQPSNYSHFRASRLWIIAAVLCGLFVLATGLAPFQFGSPANDAPLSSRISLIPFQASQLSRLMDAIADLSAKLLRYLMLGTVVAILLQSAAFKNQRARFLVCVGCVTAFAIAIEALHLLTPTRRADITTVLLATIAAASGWLLLNWIVKIERQLRIIVADDWLTGQLIEGPTYSEPGITPPARLHADASPKGQAESDPRREYSR